MNTKMEAITDKEVDDAARKIGIDLETMTQNDRNATRALIWGTRKLSEAVDTILEIQLTNWEIASLNEQENQE